MSAKYRNMVAMTWNGPNGPFMLKATTDREVARMCRKHGMPSHVDALRVKTGETRTPADNLPLSGAIPTSKVEGLISVKSFIEDESGTEAQPMTFRVMGTHDGANPDSRDAYVEPGLLRAIWANYVAGSIRPTTDEPDIHHDMPGSTQMPSLSDIFVASGPTSPKLDKALKRAIRTGNRRTVDIMDAEGQRRHMKASVFVVDSKGQCVQMHNGGSFRFGPAETYRDGTPKPKADMYLIYGEKGQNQHKLTQEDMNQVTAREAVEVQRMCMNMARSRDAQRINKKSDISAKSDGADMWDAMQDSVLFFAQALVWAQDLPVMAYDVETHEPAAWGYIPRKAHEMAAEADILGQEFEITAYHINMTRKSLMWQAVRNAMMANFTVPDRTKRAFKAKVSKPVISDDMAETTITLEEYTQMTDNGAPGYTLLYPDRFPATWDGSHQGSAEPARSGWNLRLRNGKGGSTRKPQHVAIGTLRTSSDNPYNDVRFRAAWDNGDKYPLLTLLFQLGINEDDMHKADVWRRVAQMVHDGSEVTWRQIRDIKAQGRTEWTNLRESLGYLEDLTSGTDAPAQDNAVDVADL